MQITIKIKSICYSDIALRLLPALKTKLPQPGAAMGRLLEALTDLPETVIHSVFEAIPMETQNEIVALLAAENQDRLLTEANALLESQEISARVEDLFLTRELELTAFLGSIDYTALAEKFIPLLRSINIAPVNPAAVWLGRLLQIPGFLLRGAVSAIPQDTKDDIVIYLINNKKEVILRKLTNLAGQNGIRLELADIRAGK